LVLRKIYSIGSLADTSEHIWYLVPTRRPWLGQSLESLHFELHGALDTLSLMFGIGSWNLEISSSLDNRGGPEATVRIGRQRATRLVRTGFQIHWHAEG
jgi:hypothetical protein